MYTYRLRDLPQESERPAIRGVCEPLVQVEREARWDSGLASGTSLVVSKNDLEQTNTDAVRQKCPKVAMVGETRELRVAGFEWLGSDDLSHNVFLFSRAWTTISSFANTLYLAWSV
jgi:hypothetical protein